MSLRLVRWPEPEPPTEAQLRDCYAREGLQPSAWGNAPYDRYPEHEHPYHKVLYCLSGSIRFIVRGEPYDLRPGDRLDLPPYTPHSAVVGPQGVTCLEAHRAGGA
jgi:mannose-6-phosphate isomerase-like protein (cupin superfamily)